MYNRNNFYLPTYEGTAEEAAEYIRENYKNCKWDCPTGVEDTEGIISVLNAGVNVLLEIDGIGNIRCKGSLETFATIV